MLGFIVGTACLIGLVKVVRAGRGWCGCGSHYGCGYERRWAAGPSCGDGHRPSRSPGAWWRRRALRGLFERLETMPGQERVIVEALDRLAGSRAMLRDELRQTGADVARAIESGLVDDATLEETFARHDRALAQLRVSIVEALKTTTEALDERQRKELASILARRAGSSGPFGAWA